MAPKNPFTVVTDGLAEYAEANASINRFMVVDYLLHQILICGRFDEFDRMLEAFEVVIQKLIIEYPDAGFKAYSKRGGQYDFVKFKLAHMITWYGVGNSYINYKKEPKIQ